MAPWSPCPGPWNAGSSLQASGGLRPLVKMELLTSWLRTGVATGQELALGKGWPSGFQCRHLEARDT